MKLKLIFLGPMKTHKGFFMSGVTAADFRQMGKQPDSKESIIVFDITGNNVSSICGTQM